jgi:ATP adenylyltransferase
MMELATRGTRVLEKIYGAEGFNVGINLGEAAGAGLEEHIHLHIVPRWSGDSNFMAAVGETRVLPEDIRETYRRIKAEW